MGYNNPAFIGDDNKLASPISVTTANEVRRSSNTNGAANGRTSTFQHVENTESITAPSEPATEAAAATATSPAAAANTSKSERANWGNDIEFLMSCIAMSVGLGNVWRFPFTALENGGGAFLIPYLIVLSIIGRPLYYMEMIIGQFSSRGSIKVYDMVPALRGVGYGQVISTGIVATYYVTIMAITLHYFYNSFKSTLPWSMCLAEWGDSCTSSSSMANVSYLNQSIAAVTKHKVSSGELYYTKTVLKEYETIHHGIGMPDLYLAICLLGAWIFIVSVLIKGVQSSGKASYFLALFPYVVIFILLIRAVTLPGATAGILYFIRPQWDRLFDPTVWYAAITQCFFSLAVCFGNLIMYASFNKFDHNVYRDATIVTTLDTFTSLLAGVTIFGILGHLAHEIGTDDIGDVVNPGAGLAFISYPDAIARFEFLPQVFSVLFFFMLFVLGIGSNIAMCSCIITAIRDQFPSVKASHAALGVAFVGFLIGLVYITPGGQYMLALVDFFGASFIVFIMSIAEMVAVFWIYGVNRLCRDIEFMSGRRTGLYWRLCWGLITPAVMITILLYTFITFKPLTYRGYVYPDMAYAIGWTIFAFGLAQLPIFAFVAVVKQKGNTWTEKISAAFRPSEKWGPSDPITFEKYQKYISQWKSDLDNEPSRSIFGRIKRKLFD